MKIIILITLCFFCSLLTHADVLELKNGQVLTGKYSGGTAATIRFEGSAGLQVIETGKVLALTFTGASVAPVAAAAAPIPAPEARQSSSVSIPAGTLLLVRMVDGASSRDPRGKRFTTTLETDLVVDGRVIAKTGTRAYGRVANAQQAGRYVGRSFVDLRLSELNIGGALVAISTGPYAEAGAGSLGKTARGAATGAAIGAIAGDAGKGAAIGATASGIKRGQTVGVRPGELIEFRLLQPLTVELAS